MKQVFSEYGVPMTVMSDRGLQFSPKEFKAVTNQYCSNNITSRPRYPQSNGLIEQMVQTVKQCLKKYMAAGHDPNLAMLIYKVTAFSTSLPASAELMNGKRYRELQPTIILIQWTSATITQRPTATQPWSYTVEAKDRAHYQRNRKFISLAQEKHPYLVKQQKVSFPVATS